MVEMKNIDSSLLGVSGTICIYRGLKIIREGDDYYLVHQGQIQRGLGSRRESTEDAEVASSGGILDKIFFFIGDMEAATTHAKRNRLV